jgi:putative phosphoesterase
MILFLSDLHLGNPHCHADKIIEMFEKYPHRDEICLVGDIIDDHQYRHWPCEHLLALQYILKFRKITYVTGNHDDFMRGLHGFETPFHPQSIQIAKEFIFFTDKKKYLVTHGHLYDWTMRWAFISSRTLGHWSRTFFSGTHTWFNYNHYVKRLVAEAKRQGCDGVICGHVHEPEIREIDGILYINCGDWMGSDTAVVQDGDEFHLTLTANHQDDDPICIEYPQIQSA